jgi:hypothetical protein
MLDPPPRAGTVAALLPRVLCGSRVGNRVSGSTGCHRLRHLDATERRILVDAKNSQGCWRAGSEPTRDRAGSACAPRGPGGNARGGLQRTFGKARGPDGAHRMCIALSFAWEVIRCRCSPWKFLFKIKVLEGRVPVTSSPPPAVGSVSVLSRMARLRSVVQLAGPEPFHQPFE